MKKHDLKIWNALCLVVFFLLGLTWQTAQSAEDRPSFLEPTNREFFEALYEQVSAQAAAKVYDYQKRPLIRTAIVNFLDPSGRETVFGRDLADYLRLRFSREKQFFVYGQAEPIGLALQAQMLKDSQFKTGLQKSFQESQAYTRTPVDLVIAGQTEKEDESRIRVTVRFIPLFEGVSAMDGELNRINYTSLTFLTPPRPPEAVGKALALMEKPKRKHGRLIVLSRLEYPGSKPRLKETPLSGESQSLTSGARIPGEPWKLGSIKEISCWLNEEEIKLLRKEEWDDSRQRVYRNVLSGFKANAVWLDKDLPPGDHTLMVSLFPVNGIYKSFKRSFQIKEDATYYLFFSLGTDRRKEPVLQVKVVTDANNGALPF